MHSIQTNSSYITDSMASEAGFLAVRGNLGLEPRFVTVKGHTFLTTVKLASVTDGAQGGYIVKLQTANLDVVARMRCDIHDF